MSWNSDLPPLEYLQRRVVYYKKRIGMVKGLLKRDDDSLLWRKYGNKLPEIVERKVIHYEWRITQFNSAINKLYKGMGIKPTRNNVTTKKKRK
jgi:hypothetical protein